MKRMLAVLFAALLLMAGFAWAEEAKPTVHTSGDWEYVLLADGTAEIVDYNGKATELTVPGEIDGVVVTRIGDYAFEYLSLTSITLPDSIVNIRANPFAYCTELTDIIVSPEHPTLANINGVLFERTERRLVCYPCAFTAHSYTVPQGIRSIGDDAFSCCSSLTSIMLPGSLTTIGDRAFYGCDSLTNITLPESITSIGVFAFSFCNSLTSITLPDSVTNISANPFAYCTELTDIIVSPEHPTLANINGVLFEKTEKRLVCYPCAFTASSYTVPQGIHIIGDDAFSCCDSLTSIILPDSITSIDDGAFYLCKSLMNITLPDALTSIGYSAFDSCESLTALTLPTALTNIGDYAFMNCRSLTLTIPRNSWLVQWCKDNNLRYTYPDSLDWLLE